MGVAQNEATGVTQGLVYLSTYQGSILDPFLSHTHIHKLEVVFSPTPPTEVPSTLLGRAVLRGDPEVWVAVTSLMECLGGGGVRGQGTLTTPGGSLPPAPLFYFLPWGFRKKLPFWNLKRRRFQLVEKRQGNNQRGLFLPRQHFHSA